MSQFRCGDVVLVSLILPNSGSPKTRPAIILGSDPERNLLVCPVSHKPSHDTSSIPLSIDDFEEGGLDLFDDSYILLEHLVKIHPREVKGKKGHLIEKTIFQVMSELSRKRKMR